jgi:hypothetical protein
MRVTRDQLREKVAGLVVHDGVDIAIHWAMGWARCTTKNEQRDLSPRLPNREMSIWLAGFTEGMRTVERRNEVLRAFDGR